MFSIDKPREDSRTFFFCLCLFLVILFLRPAAGELLLVSQGKSNYSIYVAPDATMVVRVAAKELRTFMKQSTGVELPLIKEGPPRFPAIILGANSYALGAGISPEGIPSEGFRIKTEGPNIFIVGRDTEGGPLRISFNSNVQCGTMSGVYEFLERFLGVMFCWHEELGTIVPRQEKVTIPEIDFTDGPDWDYRSLPYSPDGQTGRLYGRRLRLGHPFSVMHRHMWMTILPIEKYGKEHPEYYAEINGQRRPRYYLGHHGGQVCTSNPDVIRIFAASAIEYFNKYPQFDMFSLSPNDGGGFCQCKNCRALDGGDLLSPEQGGGPVLTDRLLAFYNAIAGRVAKVHPDKLLGAYIYGYYKKPPRREKPHSNLFLLNATNSAFAQGKNWAQENKWERQWTTLSRRIYKYDIYYFARRSINLIAPMTTHLIEKIKAEHENGIRGGYLYMGQSYEQLGAGHYLLAKLMWDKNADARSIEKRYYQALYGPAAEDVKGYYDLLESRLRKVYLKGLDGEPSELRRLCEGTYPLSSPYLIIAAYWPILDTASEVIGRARSRSLDEAQAKRIGRLEVQHQFMLATVRGMVAASRLEQQGGQRPEEVARLKAAVAQREAAKLLIKQYAPRQYKGIREMDLRETAKVSAEGAFYQLAQKSGAPEVVSKCLTVPPDIDGRAGQGIWRKCPRYYFLLTKNAAHPSLGIRASMGHDSANLYLFIEGREPNPKKLVIEGERRDDARLFNGDNVEVFLQPAGKGKYFHLAMNSAGVFYDAVHPTGLASEVDVSWDSRAQVAAAADDSGWAAEMAIPFKSLGPSPANASAWRINLCRTRRGNVEPDEYTALAPTFGGFHQPHRFARLLFKDDPTWPGFKFGTFDRFKKGDFKKSIRFTARGEASIERVTDQVYAGSHALHMTVGKDSLGEITLTARVTGEKSYRALIAHRNQLSGLNPAVRKQAPILRVIFRGPDGKAVTPSEGYSWEGAPAKEKPGQWRVSSHIFKTPKGTTSITWSLFFHHPGQYWIDEARLVE